MEITARIANPPGDLVAKYTRKEQGFFFDYANYTLALFESPEVQTRLRLLLKIESMESTKTLDMRIMVFPARPLHGRPRSILHGSYNHDTAQISIYPLKMDRVWIRQEGFRLFKTRPEELTWNQRKTLREMFLTAVSTLIHEVLHVKFETRNLSRYSEEAIVRKLERQYAAEWMETFPASTIESQLPLESVGWA